MSVALYPVAFCRGVYEFAHFHKLACMTECACVVSCTHVGTAQCVLPCTRGTLTAVSVNRLDPASFIGLTHSLKRDYFIVHHLKSFVRNLPRGCHQIAAIPILTSCFIIPLPWQLREKLRAKRTRWKDLAGVPVFYGIILLVKHTGDDYTLRTLWPGSQRVPYRTVTCKYTGLPEHIKRKEKNRSCRGDGYVSD